MRRFVILAAMISTLGLVAAPPAGAIVYGQFDGNMHPNVGTYVIEIEGQLISLCSGTLIAEDVFLTAGHCTDFGDAVMGANEGWVSFDPVFNPGTSVLYSGTTHTHPDFGFSGPGGISDPHDIAVIILDQAPNITPAQLPTEGLLDGLKSSHQLRHETFTAVGYGAVRETRKKGPQNILDNNQRRYALQSALTLLPSWLQLSMNEATGNGGTCYGDSGGPHFLGGADSNLIVSITVTGDSVCKATDLTYRLDTASARDFLDDFVNVP